MRLLCRFPALLVAALVLPVAAEAAAPLKAKVRAPAARIGAEPWIATVTVTRGGVRVRGLAVRVRAQRQGTKVAARAAPVARGVYRAQLVFPLPGRWYYGVLVSGRRLARGSVSVTMPEAPVPPAPPAPPPPPSLLPCTLANEVSAAGAFQEWTVQTPARVHPHDLWPAGDGTVWYTGQFKGTLGRLNVATGAFHEIPLGPGSAPHGVISGPDGDAWVTDQGRNSIIRVDRETETLTEYPVPGPNVAPHTAAWDNAGILWFTGIAGYVGRVNPATGAVTVWPAPRGEGPYGIETTPSGDVWFVSLRSNSYLGRIDRATGAVTVVEPPRPGVQLRRVWSDSAGRLWASEWAGGCLARYDPATATWSEWRMPSVLQSAGYAITVDAADDVWVTDFGTNALVRFRPSTASFSTFPFPSSGAAVRQIVADSTGVWGAESGVDKIVRFAP